MKFLGETVVPEAGPRSSLTQDVGKHLQIVDLLASQGLGPSECVLCF